MCVPEKCLAVFYGPEGTWMDAYDNQGPNDRHCDYPFSLSGSSNPRPCLHPRSGE